MNHYKCSKCNTPVFNIPSEGLVKACKCKEASIQVEITASVKGKAYINK